MSKLLFIAVCFLIILKGFSSDNDFSSTSDEIDELEPLKTETNQAQLLNNIREPNILCNTRRLIRQLIRQIFNQTTGQHQTKCFAVITDPIYGRILRGNLIKDVSSNLTRFMISVKESDDLLSPNERIIDSLRNIRKEGCQLYVILIANAIQAIRLLKFSETTRIINTRVNFILAYDERLFQPDICYIWRRIINIIFIRHAKKFQKYGSRRSDTFELSTVPYPQTYGTLLVPQRLDFWSNGKFFFNRTLVTDKTRDLKERQLSVVLLEHVPAVLRYSAANESVDYDGRLTGVEFQIVKTLAKLMNFQARFYEIANATERWGWKQLDGTFNGVLGEIIDSRADVALGDFHYTLYHLNLIDLTVPYNTECLTFLTPESIRDNSWQTLILPFGFYMWMGTVVTLMVCWGLFLLLANIQRTFQRPEEQPKAMKRLRSGRRDDDPPSYEEILASYFKTPDKPEFVEPIKGLYLFETITNSLLYTYSMLLFVSLPVLPSGWSLRVLTGTFWLYSILIVCCYRASLTSILANPSPRVTIDTIEELADSRVRCGGWGEESRDFFKASLDANTRKIYEKFDLVEDPRSAIGRIAKGTFAYYDNTFFLKSLSALKDVVLEEEKVVEAPEDNEWENTTMETVGSDKKLHIMKNCVINMPISIGLQKNSPLKERFDGYIRQLIECGLIERWLNEVNIKTVAGIKMAEEKNEMKALMNLKKFSGALVILLAGYVAGFLTLILEILHWKYVIERHRDFNKFKMREFYARKASRMTK